MKRRTCNGFYFIQFIFMNYSESNELKQLLKLDFIPFFMPSSIAFIISSTSKFETRPNLIARCSPSLFTTSCGIVSSYFINNYFTLGNILLIYLLKPRKSLFSEWIFIIYSSDKKYKRVLCNLFELKYVPTLL